MANDNSAKIAEMTAQLNAFMEEHIYPREMEYNHYVEDEANAFTLPPWFEDLKQKARDAGIWNWFLPAAYEPWSPGLTNLEFAPLMEIMCRVPWSQQVFNCSAPDRGNMEVLAKYGTPEQQEKWLLPLLDGKIRSTYGMTEPLVASSDATNLEVSIVRDGDDYVINGRKWFSSNIAHPLNQFMFVMGKTDPTATRHAQHSTIIVPKGTPGCRIVRTYRVLGSLHSPGGEGEVEFKDCRVPATNLILGEGRGFEIGKSVV